MSYRIAIGPQQGCKVFTLQTILAWERQKQKGLCWFITTPAACEKRLSLMLTGNIRYQLKTLYDDENTHVIFELLDFIAKLAVLVPKPRVNLTRFHGVFAPNSKYCAEMTLSRRGKGNPSQSKEGNAREQRHQAMR
jgi:hypothetical protein